MTLGMAQRQGDLLDDVQRFCERSLPESSVLRRERDRLFPDELFADLSTGRGRRSVPPSVVATVMVLQRLEGLSDREAVERYAFDACWRYAAGVGGYDCGGWGSFAHTVLVDMRARLAASPDPRRVFRVVLQAAAGAALVGAKRVLDSTPLYDAVATMDTVTLIRSALRALLRVVGAGLEAELRAVLGSGDDYASAGKPQIDWDDAAARGLLVDSRARDAFACWAFWMAGTSTSRSAGPARMSRPSADVAAGTVYGDSAYGSGKFLDRLARAGVQARCKTQPPTAAGGKFPKDQFDVDLEADQVTCPAGVTAPVRRNRDGDGTASFAGACAACPLRGQCTTAAGGRSITVGRYEQRLADARASRPIRSGKLTTGPPTPKVERRSGM